MAAGGALHDRQLSGTAQPKKAAAAYRPDDSVRIFDVEHQVPAPKQADFATACPRGHRHQNEQVELGPRRGLPKASSVLTCSIDSDLPGFFGPMISRKMAPNPRGAHEKESIH